VPPDARYYIGWHDNPHLLSLVLGFNRVVRGRCGVPVRIRHRHQARPVVLDERGTIRGSKARRSKRAREHVAKGTRQVEEVRTITVHTVEEVLDLLLVLLG